MALRLLPFFSCSGRVFITQPRPFDVLLPRQSPRPSILAFSRRRSNTPSTTSSVKKKKVKKEKKGLVEEDDFDGDPFEALFSQLEEDLKNDNSDIEDDDDYDEIKEEDVDRLASELADALGNFDLEAFTSTPDDAEEEEEERPVKLKNWQLRRLAAAVKVGRRKTSIKSLATELCLDRHVVLELLREPPPELLMLSATLPDEPPKREPVLETKPVEPVALETTVDSVKHEPKEPKVKEPVHVMQHRWSAQKRLKKVQVETLEKVYRRSKRPTNAMISSIVQVTNLPRKKVVKWFEDKRNEDGIPEHHQPYQSLKQQRFCVSYCTTSNRVQKNMATLQRSAVSFRREGSSGSVWDDLYVLGEDGTVHYRDQLRPCQSTRERSSSTPVPNACPRSMSTPAMDPSSLIKVFGKLSREDKPFPEVPKLPQSKSKKHKA
ncbi:Overexpressor of cationic peroxidase 3, putative [Theobroma cacao]|uniref:Overexpressor of cationic peroxidase 3, putative n=1 Tax=Theobroma cacao TaxID=3641 RepID=A0A061GPW0_THECC|nr:Overexpressor of cationic peroxidase 3, putative [Theobroma cacao]